MGKRSITKKYWTELGYELFSEEGHEGLQVERLARILGKNKSGFYHHFGDREVFLHALMQEHLRIGEEIGREIQKIQEFDPEYMELMMRYKRTVLFQMHLVQNREIKEFFNTAQKVNQLISENVAPVFSRYLGVPMEEGPLYWGMLRDTFYSRVTFKTFTPEWIAAFAAELKALVAHAAERKIEK